MKPNLDKIIQDNLDKVKFQSKLKPSLPKNTGWLDQYARGGTYISGKALATQFGQYQGGGQPPKKKIYTDKAEFDKAMQAKNDSLDAYRLSNQIKRIYPNLNEISKEKFNDINKKDSLITHYDLDMVEYNKDKKKGITKPLNTYVYSRANGNYNDPIFLKNNQKELDKYSYNENDITKHSITLPNGDIKTPLTVYNGKPDWSDYSIQSTNGTLRTYFSNSNNNPELGNIRVENNKPIKTHYYGNDNPIPMGTITESSTGWYNGKKPDLKKLKDYKNYAYQSETIDEYQKPNTQPVYQPPTQNNNKSNNTPTQQTNKKPVVNQKPKPSFKDFVKTANPDYMSDDYDLEAAYKNLPEKTMKDWARDPEKNHLPDTYKKPNHPTFSKESIYYKPGMEAGTWHDDMYVPNRGRTVGRENNLQVIPNTGLIDRSLQGINTDQQPTNYSFHYPIEGTFDRVNPQGVKYFKDRAEWEKFVDENGAQNTEERNGQYSASGYLKKGKYGGWLSKYEEGGEKNKNYVSLKNNKDWFDSHANWTSTGNDEYDAWVRNKVLTGRFGVDPKSNELIKLPQNEWTDVPDSYKEQTSSDWGKKSYYKRFNSETPAGKQVRKNALLEENRKMLKNPVTYGPAAVLAAPFIAAAAAPAVPIVSAAMSAPIAGVSGLTTANLLNAGFAYQGLKNLSNVKTAVSNAYNSPSSNTIGNAVAETALTGLDMLPFLHGAYKGIPSVVQDINQAGNYLTTQTPLKNTYKINPYAERLNNANKSYRVAGLDAAEDFQNTGLLRSVQQGLPEGASLTERAMSRSTGFPSFQKGYADMRYAPEEGAVVFETGLPTFKRGELNPVTGFPIKGRHYAHRVIDPKTGATMAEIPGENIRMFGDKPHWLKGYPEIPKSNYTNKTLNKFTKSFEPNLSNIGLEEELFTPKTETVVDGNNQSYVNSTLKEVKSPTWQLQELPGLHLQSTMSNGAISKIVEPKTGLVNVEQALGIIGKESGGADKVALIKQGLGETFPKKMDYNEFRKVVQDQLIPLEKQFTTHSSNYGIGRLGYLSPKRKSYDLSIQSTKDAITRGENVLENQMHLEKLLNEYTQLPLENQTFILGNKNKLGRGSSAHGNPEETLGHAHFLRDTETPDVLTVTQIQSDAFQGTHRVMPKQIPDPLYSRLSLERMEKLQKQNKSILDKMKIEGVDEAGLPVQEYQIKQFEDIVKGQEAQNIMKKAELENHSQKSLLDKNHQERYLQELVNYAGERGDISKIRLPTSETAAKIQGYEPMTQEALGPNAKAVLDKSNSFDEFFEWMVKDMGASNATKEEIQSIREIYDGYKSGTFNKPIYEPGHKTILKKYAEQPKTIKKIFGKEPTLVTDSKGNTWYEFEIPENFKGTKGEIKAFKYGGDISIPNLNNNWLNNYIKNK